MADDLVAGRYQLVRALGRGGMGEVMLARQLNLDRLVVVKRVTDVRSKRNLKALADEARIAARLNHPNIVSILDVIDSGDQPVIVMEFVVGVSLRELIEDAPAGLPLDVALPIAIDLLRGLGYAHSFRGSESAGVVHRDVKPRNVMVTFAGVTKLIDFGISRWLGDEGNWEATSVSGTRGYMAPEQQRGHRVDGRADLYAAGVTLREMLTGIPPIDDTGNAEALRAPRAVADPALAAIVERACAELPDDRFADCATMIAAIEAFAATSSIPLSVTHVDRWTTSRFAERKQSFESVDRTPQRPRPPTSPTVLESSRVARGSDRTSLGSRIAFVARNAGEPTDDWLAPVVERMIRRAFRYAEDRRFHIVAARDPLAQEVTLVFRREVALVAFDAVAGGEILGSASGASVYDAIEAIARVVHEIAPESSLEPTPQDLAEMKRFGARSFRAFQRYGSAVERYLDSTYTNSRAIAASMEMVLEEDPEWAHGYALLIVLYGIWTPDAASTLATARARCTRERDPLGMRMLDAVEAQRRENHVAAQEILEEVFRAAPEPLVGYQLVVGAVVRQQLDDASAVARRCHELYPDLWFAVDLADCYQRTGRERDAERAVRDCVAQRPENLSATVALVRLESAAVRIAEAKRHTERVQLIHGERPEISAEVFDALVASEQLFAAQRIAERMLLGVPLERARGRYRMAIVAVMEGKLGTALNGARRAIDENRPFGWESELTQCLELGRATAHAIGDTSGERTFTRELADTLAGSLGDAGSGAAVRFELALLDSPDSRIDDHLAELRGADRDLARTRMLRAANAVGRVTDREVVAAGFCANEDDAGSLNALGMAAQRIGELELARRSFEMAVPLWSSMLTNRASPIHAILARYYLAGVLAKSGDVAAARAQYEAFLRRWGSADRPVSEVALARRALAAL